MRWLPQLLTILSSQDDKLFRSFFLKGKNTTPRLGEPVHLTLRNAARSIELTLDASTFIF